MKSSPAPVTRDTKLRRFLLRPLSRRTLVADQSRISTALNRLYTRAVGEDILPAVTKALRTARSAGTALARDPDATRAWVRVVRALRASRRISYQEYVFFAAAPVESLYESRWLDRSPHGDVAEITEKMARIEKQYGLKDDQYWSRGEAPAEYQGLCDQYDALFEKDAIRALREFGLDDIAELRELRPEEFARCRERGRRAAFHEGEFGAVLRDIILQYEADAKRSADAGSYSAAVTLLGAAIEGVLLLRCLRSKRKAASVASLLPKGLRPSLPDNPTAWRFETLIEVCRAAGWLPPISTSIGEVDPSGLAHILRQMRNLVHPARRVRERPWSEVHHDDYLDAQAIYMILASTMRGRRSKSREPLAR